MDDITKYYLKKSYYCNFRYLIFVIIPIPDIGSLTHEMSRMTKAADGLDVAQGKKSDTRRFYNKVTFLCFCLHSNSCVKRTRFPPYTHNRILCHPFKWWSFLKVVFEEMSVSLPLCCCCVTLAHMASVRGKWVRN
ncbi:hypothetical protein CEXT_735791 [Caerostris extrusa]|uniref:Uncharacterized protein n=1 Tax=Caerostris extrusa TaxID=172846 RepID=A0AAV4NVS8_CAEEX|nr:hypothetical protein CEXT_735791 [Caerostris extrusa]